ncbi:protein PFF0380w-like [Nymphalis io]|uniref:protein PFF0380w-like n=1 Tax=Inachis io TaxID=171585 RepID=UPI002167C1EE|nr:protein PFF0380w-like [Nymphalis io]
MSTDESDSITSSQIRRFGLYRTIDARTEEFQRLSKKKQMRQGCTCAAISTTITVTVVVIVLVIYEYMIAVETSFVQEKRFFNKTKYIHKDLPIIADRLDRNFFGFDQDYYERMPLLINALQDKSTTDSETRIRSQRKKQISKNYTIKPRTSTVLNRFIRRTSPRPFIFEYKSPYPMPFTKVNSSPSNWMEQYRNAQRLKNLHDVIKYLEKTLNAKFGDIYLPTRAQIAFSGMYVGPVETKDTNSNIKTVIHSSPQSNHYSDPLYIYRPNNPGEVNLLADGLRFAPTFVPRLNKQNTEMKHPVTSKQSCVGLKCLVFNKNILKSDDLSSAEGAISTISPQLNNNKLKSLMLNLFPINKSNSQYKNELDHIFITTSKPIFQFKRKYTGPVRRFSYRNNKGPTFFKDGNKSNFLSQINNVKNTTTQYFNHHTNIQNINNEIKISEPKKNYFDFSTINSDVKATFGNSHVINYPKVNYSDIEDYHMGSSGIIPVDHRRPPINPVTSIIPLSELFMSTTETMTTNPPDIIKFSPEDAKVPDHYMNVRKSNTDKVTESEINKLNYSESTEVNYDEYEPNTLIVKLKNTIGATSEENANEETSTTEGFEMKQEENIYTTVGTYVPQINGHYRNVKHKSLISLLQESSEKYRKKRIESLLTTRNPTYVPMYFEIKRNRNNTASNQY